MAARLAQVVDELGYGGQAGGGKTDLALGLAGTVFTRSLIMRREFPQLEGIIDRGNEIYPSRYVAGSKRRWEFTVGGRRHVVTLGSLQYESDWTKYQGRGRNCLTFDEAAEFPEFPVRAIAGWNRDPDARQHTLLLLLFNPPQTAEGQWIVEYFKPWLDETHPNPAQPGEIRYFARLDDVETEVNGPEPFTHKGETIHPVSRTFVPASRHDNPYLGEEYERRLQVLPEPLRSQVLFGDFSIGVADDEWQCIPTQWVIDAQERWKATEQPESALRALGADVSRGGADETVLARLYENYFAELVYKPGKEVPDGPAGAKLISDHLADEAPVYIDAVGIGASVYDSTKDLAGVTAYPINAGAKASGRDKSGRYPFFNLRAQMIWRFREALDPSSGEDICLPPDRKLRADLCAPRYQIVSGKIKVEEKVAIKKRIGRSTDAGDAVVMTWHGAHSEAVPHFEFWD